MLKKAESALRKIALGYPGAYEEFPWGERVVKVDKKVFLFLYADASQLSLSTKLPESSSAALTMSFAEPTGYGLGKSGWVSSRFEKGDSPPVELLRAWIDESYRAVAKKKRLLELAGPAAGSSVLKKSAPVKRSKKAAPASRKKAAARKPKRR
jgi:predicted DNA-binding protein (MmcQ/YjbR family)